MSRQTDREATTTQWTVRPEREAQAAKRRSDDHLHAPTPSLDPTVFGRLEIRKRASRLVGAGAFVDSKLPMQPQPLAGGQTVADGSFAGA